jgi:ankyrin repeat protein
MACHNQAGVKALLDQGANPDLAHDEDGSTPVLLASAGDSVDTLKLLLARGGNPNARDAGDSALTAALMHGQFENYYALLAAGADISSADAAGWTAADTAISLAYFDKVIEMLQLGYSYDLADLYKVVLLCHVDINSPQYKNKKQVIKLLDARGIKPEEVPTNAQY